MKRKVEVFLCEFGNDNRELASVFGNWKKLVKNMIWRRVEENIIIQIWWKLVIKVSNIGKRYSRPLSVISFEKAKIYKYYNNENLRLL